nr:MAG TPA: hypothetical protein [Bacteriophage sp.]
MRLAGIFPCLENKTGLNRFFLLFSILHCYSFAKLPF